MMVVTLSQLDTRMTTFSPLPSPDLSLSHFEDNGTAGYDFEFVPVLDNKYMCPICLLALRDPVQTECGHRFCHLCILRCIKNIARCPVDQTPLSARQLFQDRSAHREVLDLQVKCINKDCIVISELRNIQRHIDNCPLRKVSCKHKCGLIFLVRDLAFHEDTQCIMRPVHCDMCGQTYPANQKKEHEEDCKQHQLVECPHCQYKVKRYRLKQHISGECPQAPIHCVFDKVGCHKTYSRHEIQTHMETSTQIHLQYLLSTVAALQKQNDDLQDNLREAKSKLNQVEIAEKKKGSLVMESPSITFDPDYDESLVTLTSSWNLYTPDAKIPGANSTSSAVEELDEIARIKAHNKRMEESEGPGVSSSTTSSSSSPGDPFPGVSGSFESQCRSAESIRVLESKHKEHDQKIVGLDHHVRELKAKMDNQVTMMKEINVKLVNVEQRLEESELRCCNGLYYWRIRDYSKLRKAATLGDMSVLHSPGFYTTPQGYRMCIRANLDGVERAQGTHLSLFVHIMKGEYDDILSWPFHGSITLTVLNQSEVPAHRAHISETLEARSNLMAFQRPVTERNQKGYGYIDFISLQMLETDCFIKANTLVIKAQVKVNDSNTR